MSLPMTKVMQIYDFRWDLVFSNCMLLRMTLGKTMDELTTSKDQRKSLHMIWHFLFELKIPNQTQNLRNRCHHSENLSILSWFDAKNNG